ncbi:MAG: hypothetical protein OXH84_06190 [Gammaproteobacteria bacterium]|nr:hypothetical protein [Gammaproteobacteria bacterium]
MKTTPRFNLWLGTSVLALIALSVGIFLWLSPPQPIPPDQPAILPNSLIASSSTPTATIAATDPVIPALVSPKLPPVDYPPGSVGEACEVNEFPSFDWYSNLDFDIRRSLENHPYDLMQEKLKKETCMTALERHMYSINPYLWETPNETKWKKKEKNLAFSFVVIDNPMTFERIFTDPLGDFARVQEALAHPECQLGKGGAKSNYQLNETCHADAIHNYALVLRYCYDEHYIFEDSPTVTTLSSTGMFIKTKQPATKPTPEEDRHKWIQELEDDWLKEKCWSLDRTLDLNSELHTELSRQIQAIMPARTLWIEKSVNAGLIELAARLGDAAAGLTKPFFYSEEGYQYGPLAGWFASFYEPTQLGSKHQPSVERLQQLVLLFERRFLANNGEVIKFDHEALVRHLCTPPYDPPFGSDQDHVSDPPSCRDIITELRQKPISSSILGAIDTFEDVAMRLDVYE